jgi:hypothetical protein
MSDLSIPVDAANDASATQFSHVKPGDTPWRPDGLRDFFLYRDLGVAEATGGKVIAHLVKANMAPEKGTGWHRHEAEFQIVLMTRRLRAPAPRHRALPVRLLAGHGVPGDRLARRFQDGGRAGTLRGAGARAVGLNQKSMSSCSISSGSNFAAAVHSCSSGIALMVLQ